MVKYDWYIPLLRCVNTVSEVEKIRTLDFFLLLLGFPRSRAGAFYLFLSRSGQLVRVVAIVMVLYLGSILASWRSTTECSVVAFSPVYCLSRLHV